MCWTPSPNPVLQSTYNAEEILQRRRNTTTEAWEYLVKWEGFPHDRNTWEPAENVVGCAAFEKFEETLKSTTKVRSKKR